MVWAVPFLDFCLAYLPSLCSGRLHKENPEIAWGTDLRALKNALLLGFVCDRKLPKIEWLEIRPNGALGFAAEKNAQFCSASLSSMLCNDTVWKCKGEAALSIRERFVVGRLECLLLLNNLQDLLSQMLALDLDNVGSNVTFVLKRVRLCILPSIL